MDRMPVGPSPLWEPSPLYGPSSPLWGPRAIAVPRTGSTCRQEGTHDCPSAPDQGHLPWFCNYLALQQATTCLTYAVLESATAAHLRAAAPFTTRATPPGPECPRARLPTAVQSH